MSRAFYTVPQAAKELQCGTVAVRRMIREGRLPAASLPGVRGARIAHEAIVAMLSGQEVATEYSKRTALSSTVQHSPAPTHRRRKAN